MSRASIVDSGGPVEELISGREIKDTRVNRDYPNCHYGFNNSDVSHYLAGLPIGVKFNPSDVELLEHLAAKCGAQDLKPHMLIDEFIPTLEGDEGICYTHPENLPGAKKDGSTFYCFYRIVNAYASGKRKRRRIQNQESAINSRVRWHKTGKTKAVMKNEFLIGYKKIMVLYGASKGGPSSDKCPWVMHQYHLGTNEEEQEGEFVVSKIFYQPQKEVGKSKTSLVISESETGMVIIPRTPKENTPDPPRAGITVSSEYGVDDLLVPSLVEDAENEIESAINLGGESQAADKFGDIDLGSFNGIIDSPGAIGDFKPYTASLTRDVSTASSVNPRDDNAFGDLFNELDTLPDFQLNDLQFGSQDSLFEWMR